VTGDAHTTQPDPEAIFWLRRIHELIDEQQKMSKKQFRELEVEIEAIRSNVKRELTAGFKTQRAKTAPLFDAVRTISDDLRRRLWEYQTLSGNTEALSAVRKLVDFARESIYQQQGRTWDGQPMLAAPIPKKLDMGGESMGVYFFGHHVPIPVLKFWHVAKHFIWPLAFVASHLARTWLKGHL